MINSANRVPKPFLEELKEFVGVFTMGNVNKFDMDMDYLGDYQNHIDALYDYPTYQLIKEVFGGKLSMYQASRHFKNLDTKFFIDPDAMGTFVDSMDEPRFHHRYPDSNNQAAVLFSMSVRGIPMFMYG